MFEIFGWIGSALFSLCALPQVIHAWRTKDGSGMSWGFLGMWGVGIIFTWSFVINTDLISGKTQWPLHANYLACGIFCTILIYFKIKFKKD